MNRFIKTSSVFLLFSFIMLSISGCGGEDFQRLTQKLFPVPDKEEDSVGFSDLLVPDKITINYKSVINAENLITSSNTGSISIGILDNGFNSQHIELADRLVIEQNYDDITVNNDFLSKGNSIAWSWADHGTGVAGLVLGKNSGIAPQAEAVTALNRSLTGFFDAEEYFQTFTKDEMGRFIDSSTGEENCVQHIYFDSNYDSKLDSDSDSDSNPNPLKPRNPKWFPWCVNYSVYSFEKLIEASSFNTPVINLSSTTPFGHYQVGIDLSFNQAKWDDGSYEAEWASASLAEFNELYFYDYNSSYNKIQDLLSTNDLIIVLGAGNDSQSLTQKRVLEWQALKASSTNPLAQTIINVFFDPDVDGNSDGIIDDFEKGITKGLLFVGALDADNKLAWYSNYPGSSIEVQTRFIVAPGDLSIATPSLGESGYSDAAGTSLSTALVSGSIALLKVNHPSKTAREIADAVLATASKDTPDYTVETHGQGLLDVAAADAYLKIN